ncbi:MAG: hypothetical protein E7620_06340 [Ruminococcaceae bacterium]|nr:hypothetical protein [Oscillospiraceae bacterium]
MRKSIWKLLCVCLLASAQLLLAVSCGGGEEPTVTEAPSSEVTTPETTGGAENEEIDMELRYDDRYVFDSEISGIETLTVTSTNAETGEADTDVLRKDGKNPQKVIACGIGTARVTFADGSVKTVRVKTATISMLLVLGQSNAEGQIQPDTGNFDTTFYKTAIGESILCEEGQIYSTYAPGLNTTHGGGVGNARFDMTLSNTNGNYFVASSLTSKKSLKNFDLIYPLNSLSAAGKGKTGVDSGIAYEWHRVTGDKVWVINASHGGSAIESWQPGRAESDNDFWQAVNLVRSCETVLAKEIKAGHYQLVTMGYFWLQGEANMSLTAEKYMEYYQAMHEGLKRELHFDFDSDGEKDHTVAFGGIMMVRACIGHVSNQDLMMRGPRIAQYYMAQTNDETWKDVYLASAVTEKWVSDRSVERYFSGKYGASYPYQMRSSTKMASTMSDVHPNIHYRQLGYNEIGLTAANTMATLMTGGKTEPKDVYLMKVDGVSKFNNGDTVTLEAGETLIAVPKSFSGLACEGGLALTTNMEKLEIVNYSITAPHSATKLEGELRVELEGETVLTLKIVIEPVKVDLPDLPNGEDYGETVFPEIP